MYTSKYFSEELNAGKMTWKYVYGEVKELVAARSWEEFKEEFRDVMTTGLCALYGSTGISLPMIGLTKSIDKKMERLEVWKGIFEENGLKFDKKYLINGSNYLKKEKVEKALNLAKKEQM